jgi:hypothetical protein
VRKKNDCLLVAELNCPLIRDEGHCTRIILELEQRMKDWLAEEQAMGFHDYCLALEK